MASFCPARSVTTKQASNSSTDQGGGKWLAHWNLIDRFRIQNLFIEFCGVPETAAERQERAPCELGGPAPRLFNLIPLPREFAHLHVARLRRRPVAPFQRAPSLFLPTVTPLFVDGRG